MRGLSWFATGALVIAAPAGASPDAFCVAQAVRGQTERESHDPRVFENVPKFLRIYRERRAAGEGEPNVVVKNFETARNYVQRFPALRKFGFDPANTPVWKKVYARLEKSSFYGKFTGWEEKLPNGDFARYRYDYEPGRGAHWNIEMAVTTENGRRETFKMSVTFLCGTGHVCSEREALSFLNLLNR